MRQETLTVSLSQEDLFVILRYLSIPQMMGLDGRVLQQADEAQVELALSVAERGLIARGFLRPSTEGKLQPDPTIMAIVVSCAQPERSLIISNQQTGKLSEIFFFHWHRQMKVIHTVPVSGIHQFVVVHNDAAMREALQRITVIVNETLPSNDAISFSAQLTDEIIKRTREAIQDNQQALALQELTKAGIDPQIALAFVRTLANPRLIQINTYIDHKSATQSKGFSLLQGQEIAWLLKPDNSDQDSNHVIIEIATSTTYQSYLLNWLS